ncbi:hypothetical protein WI94_08865 [Burkholderia vietnamiensis]|nr:hypothetical protein WI94_08865 [Burkholderia vietnamiensis]KVE88146.1 hypothetical protein WJ00_09240 [Burkholderia vietnamiensis]
MPEEDPLQKVPERRGDAAVFYYHCDQIGTPQLLTDDDGDVVWEASYKAWGEAREVIARVEGDGDRGEECAAVSGAMGG